MSFSPVTRQQISDLVFAQLRDHIFRGEIKAGEKLLSERELAESMQVSRSSVRRAIGRLQEMGFVEHRHGQGAYVRLPQAKDSHNPFAYVMTPGKSSLDELLEVRMGLECQGVVMAAERADERDIAFLEMAYAELSTSSPDRVKAREADMNFHMGIAYATHNSVHVDLIRRFYDYMFHSIDQLQTLLYAKNRNLTIIDQQHFKILDAIKCREPDNAKRYMLQHMSFLRVFLKENATPPTDSN